MKHNSIKTRSIQTSAASVAAASWNLGTLFYPPRLQHRQELHIARKLWHFFLGLTIVLVYTLTGMSRTDGILILGSVLGLDIFVEMARLRMPSFNEQVLKVMGPFMRSCEVNRLSGVPFYLAAAVIALAIFPKTVAILSLLFLAFGDPLASTFGILYGDRGPRFSNGKSLIGTLAGITACMLVSLVVLSSLNLAPLELLSLTLIGGIAGGTAEMLPLEVDDNFAIPIVSGFVLWLAFILFGL
jgi:diacylglycerol kinase (CTP)